ncbi:GNAT family N-acetyltransferase [Adhaeretor mobilis]|uniref:Mycothiol acetyltransferase n=1 Tax=Adhaeretor mobilis TaxID=1930276 RepID=A0A517MXP5_9BACT|nr:GNAT family N-acetyltransferase [Adhaeretor mobilis]QDS99650.1 Mycothiol acetyltransferase [Adhaeretor mobilis]
MSGSPIDSDPQVVRCAVLQRPEALRILNAGLPPSQQQVLVDSLRSEQAKGDRAFAGLFHLHLSAAKPAAVWLQELPGKTGVLWPPDFAHPHTRELLFAAVQFATEQELQLVQMLLIEGEQADEAILAEVGISHLADLDYLWADPATQKSNSIDPVTNRSEENLTFRPNANGHPELLAELIANTYEKTLDCPRLNNVRDLGDVIAGYREQGTFMPEQWYVVEKEEKPIGVLILADHTGGHPQEGQTADGTWELVYMGVVPEFRGHGYSGAIIRHALQQAAEAGAARLVLAVDSQNAPAKNAYLRAGFQSWQQRIVYARLAELT